MLFGILKVSLKLIWYVQKIVAIWLRLFWHCHQIDVLRDRIREMIYLVIYQAITHTESNLVHYTGIVLWSYIPSDLPKVRSFVHQAEQIIAI